MTHNFFELAGTAFLKYLDDMFKPYAELLAQDFPIMILNTGDEAFLTNMYVKKNKAKDVDKTLSTKIPRMLLDVKGFAIQTDQLTSRSVLGNFQIVDDRDKFLRNVVANVRRIPVNWTFSVNAVFNNIDEYLKFVEVLFTVSHHNHAFTFYYSGSEYTGVFFIPEDADSEANLNLQFDTEKRQRNLPFQFVVQLQYPSFDYYNVGKHIAGSMSSSNTMEQLIHNMHVNDTSPEGIVSTIIVTQPSNPSDT